MPKSWAGRFDPQSAFSFVLVAFFGLGFLLRPNPVWAMVFYAGVLPAFVALLWSRRVQVSFRDPGLAIIVAVMIWFGLTLSWGIDQTSPRVARYLFSIPVNAAMVAAVYVFFVAAERRFVVGLFRVIPAAAALNALISVAILAHHGFGDRLWGWAETRHPILGGDVMAVALVVCLRGWATDPVRVWRRVCAASAVLCVVFILLTGSRGPFLVMAAAAICFLAQARPRALLGLAAASIVAAGGVVLFAPEVVKFVVANLDRNSYRLAIWAETLDLVRVRPWLGHGAANVHQFVDPSITFPHSIYMSALYYGGVVGLGAILALFGFGAWRAATVRDPELRAFLTALVAVPVLAGVTDIGQFIKSPSEVWYILWLPLLVVLGLSRRASDGGGNGDSVGVFAS